MNLEYLDISGKIFEQISGPGGFLIAGDESPNVMTIGWGFTGYIWRRPVFITVVRHSRYTHELLEKCGYFTVSVPPKDTMRAELAFCGINSGKDMNKIAELRLEFLPARAGKHGGIKGCTTHIECKILYKAEGSLEWMDEEPRKKFYASGDPHTLYFGEILEAYNT